MDEPRIGSASDNDHFEKSVDNFQEARRLLKELVVWTTYDDPLGQFMLMQVRERADRFLKLTEK